MPHDRNDFTSEIDRFSAFAEFIRLWRCTAIKKTGTTAILATIIGQ